MRRKASKRQYGEGSICQSHGRWYFSIHLGNGKRQTTRCLTEKNAKDLQIERNA
jgi:hypothetical protein